MRLLSAEADRQAVPLPTSPRVAVILCMRVCMSTVSQNRVVHQWRVMEALYVELGSILLEYIRKHRTEYVNTLISRDRKSVV